MRYKIVKTQILMVIQLEIFHVTYIKHVISQCTVFAESDFAHL